MSSFVKSRPRAKTARRVCYLLDQQARRAAAAPAGAAPSAGMADHARLNSIFDCIDADKSGEISPQELIVHLLSTGTEHEYVSAMFKAMDTDGNGSISREEFIAGFDHQMTAFQGQQPGAAAGEPEAEAAAAATFAAVDAMGSLIQLLM